MIYKKSERGLAGIVLVAVLFIVIISAGVGYLILKRMSLRTVAPTPNSTNVPAVSASPTPTSPETADWKIYRNEEYGFEIKYPNGWEFLVDDPQGQKYPSFRDKKYDGSFEWPGLIIDWPPIYDLEIPATESNIFKLEDAEDEIIIISFTNSFTKEPKKIVATCKLYVDSNVINICNQMLSTFRFINESGEIRIGKFEIDYNEISQIQERVDKGSQPLYLSPDIIPFYLGSDYGFDVRDSSWSSNRISGSESAGEIKYEIIYKVKSYIFTVIQPIKGKGKIWIISEIELK